MYKRESKKCYTGWHVRTLQSWPSLPSSNYFILNLNPSPQNFLLQLQSLDDYRLGRRQQQSRADMWEFNPLLWSADLQHCSAFISIIQHFHDYWHYLIFLSHFCCILRCSLFSSNCSLGIHSQREKWVWTLVKQYRAVSEREPSI